MTALRKLPVLALAGMLLLGADKPVVYRSADQMLHAVPTSKYPRRGYAWTDAELQAVNKMLAEKVMLHEATITLKVGTVKKMSGGDHDGLWCIISDGLKVGQIDVWAYCYFSGDSDLSEVRVGDSVTIKGTVSRSDFDRRDKTVPFNLDLKDCSIVKGS